MKTANFPFIKTLDDFEFDFQPGINRKEMLELGNLGFIDRKENILFVGNSGVEKSTFGKSPRGKNEIFCKIQGADYR